MLRPDLEALRKACDKPVAYPTGADDETDTLFLPENPEDAENLDSVDPEGENASGVWRF